MVLDNWDGHAYLWVHVVAAKYGEEWGDDRFYSLMKIALLVYVIIIIIIIIILQIQ